MSRADKRIQRQIEEQAWQKAGEQAFYTGILCKAWPRPEKLYTTLWYRTKAAWQRGWMAASGMQPLLAPGLGMSEMLPLDKLTVLIYELTPVRVRDLIRRFSMPVRKQIEGDLIRMKQDGLIELTGDGHRGSPVVINKVLNFVEVDLNKPEEADNNE